MQPEQLRSIFTILGVALIVCLLLFQIKTNDDEITTLKQELQEARKSEKEQQMNAKVKMVQKDLNTCTESRDSWQTKAEKFENLYDNCKVSKFDQASTNQKSLLDMEIEKRDNKNQMFGIHSAVDDYEEKRLLATIKELDSLWAKLRDVGRIIECKDGQLTGDMDESDIELNKEDIWKTANLDEGGLIEGLKILEGLDDLFQNPCFLKTKIPIQISLWKVTANLRKCNAVIHKTNKINEGPTPNINLLLNDGATDKVKKATKDGQEKKNDPKESEKMPTNEKDEF
ncbi:uncharacterized protein LOC144432787 [Glandiceps talaboti]